MNAEVKNCHMSGFFNFKARWVKIWLGNSKKIRMIVIGKIKLNKKSLQVIPENIL
jgi:hypothetical protein